MLDEGQLLLNHREFLVIADPLPPQLLNQSGRTIRWAFCHEVVRPILLVIAVRAHPAFLGSDEDAFAIQVFFVSPVGASEWMAILVLLPAIESRNLLRGERRFYLCHVPAPIADEGVGCALGLRDGLSRRCSYHQDLMRGAVKTERNPRL